MKILQINASYKPAYIYGGPTMSVSMLCEQLSKNGTQATVFTTTANGETELPVKTNCPTNIDGVTVWYFTRLTKDNSHFSPQLLFKLWQEVKNYDLIHIHAWWNLVSVFSCWIAQIRKVPVVLSPRGTLSSYSFHNRSAGVKNILHSVLGKHLLNNSHIHTTSARESRKIADLIEPKSITDLPNFVRLSPVDTIAKSDISSILKLFFFSRIDEKKGLDILFNALKKVTIPYHLTIAGTGDTEYIDELKILALANHISDKVEWIGFQTDSKFELLQKYDLMVLPSHDENFGNVVIESLSVGTAVLISENVGLADHVKKNNLGWICKTDSDSISDNIINIWMNERHELERIRVEAPKIILNDFNEDILVQKYIDMYEQIIGN